MPAESARAFAFSFMLAPPLGGIHYLEIARLVQEMAQCHCVARGIILLVGLAVAAVSLAGILLHLVYAGDARAEQSFCRYLVCAEGQLTESGYQAMYSSGAASSTRALDAFREALRRDPASPDRWCDLAGALAQYGQNQEARYCYGRALELAPNSPQMWLRSANFSFGAGDNQKALVQYARVLRLTPVYEPVVFSYLGLMDLPLSEIPDRRIPAEREVEQSFFRHLLGTGTEKEIREAWRWGAARSFTDDKLAAKYVDRLLAARRFDDAAAAWKQHLGVRAPAYLQPACLFNGDFENEPTGGAFDWRLIPTDGVKLELDQSVVHSGRRSLGVELEGKENLSYGSVAQGTVVREGAYRLSGYIRTEGLTTDRGMAFRVFDVESPGRLDARTEE